MVVGARYYLHCGGPRRHPPRVSDPLHNSQQRPASKAHKTSRVYVGYPNIAQDDINSSTLEITNMIISDPTPSSITLNQTQKIRTDSAFHPKIYSFSAAVSLLGAAVPFTTVQVPAVKAQDGAEVAISQVVDLKNASAFGDFAKAVMLNEEVDLSISGRPYLKEGGLPKIQVDYDKTVSLKGELSLL